MGILNLSPDSFSRDGIKVKRAGDLSAVVDRAQQLVREGSDILDIGGESTRPGAKAVPVKEEIRRIIPAIRLLAQKIKIPISVDTYKPDVAREALDAGAVIVNNIMGTKKDPRLLKMIARYDAAAVLMHIKGEPRTVQKKIVYRDLIGEIIVSLRKSIENCLAFGIKSDRIIIDPGIGFGKTVENNLEIIDRLKDFGILNQPLLVGTSRKSFIGKILGKEVHERLAGSVVTACISAVNGAHIIRVHDVRETKEALTLVDAITRSGT